MTAVRRPLVSLVSFVSLAVASAGLTGCPDSATSTPEGACRAYAEALAGFVARCAPSADQDADDSARTMAECQMAASLPGTGATPSRIGEAAERIEGAACTDDLDDALPDEGGLAPGAGCLESIQCAGGFCDKPDDAPGGCGACAALGRAGESCAGSVRCGAGLACVGGTCVAEPVRANAGDVCHVPGATPATPPRCAEGLVCDVQRFDVEVRCTKLGGDGAACTTSTSCARPLGCVAGTCRAPGGAGAPCVDEAGCGRDVGCVDGVCAALTYASPGEACDGARVRCRGSSCSSQGDDGRARCRREVGEGAACGQDRCVSGLVCRQGTCRTFDPNVCQ